MQSALNLINVKFNNSAIKTYNNWFVFHWKLILDPQCVQIQRNYFLIDLLIWEDKDWISIGETCGLWF